ncbi:MAG: metal-binding protein [Variovorax paradoxus]|nr:MAG: metal-binding protein [Variovorax paradoxus]PZQ13879.1 MAG: metal-binding protein [Variovorax paradoxus]
MKRRLVLSAAAAGAAALSLPARAQGPRPRVQVYKSTTCGCCGDWVDHLEAAGFAVKVIEVDDTSATRRHLGMPAAFGSCHTALVDGYVLEGHVPAAAVKRLLAARPRALGLAVPGMPVGSPGMETGSHSDAFDVLLIDKTGRASVFAHHPRT